MVRRQKERKPQMESDLEEEAEEVFNDTIQGVVESIEVTEPGPETEPGGRSAPNSKKRLDTGRSEVWTRKKPSIDDTPHQLFVEMDELRGEAWVETARWIKYEEDLETERGDWGPPHIASLSFHSLMQLRKHLEQGGFMLDTRAPGLSSLLPDLVSRLVKEGKLEEELKPKVLSVF